MGEKSLVKLRILFVDEEFAPDSDEELGSYMSYYAQELAECRNPDSKDADYEVIRCRNVDDAIASVRDDRFDLVIVDGMMPTGEALKDHPLANGGCTGWVLAEMIHGFQPTVPIVMLTNYPEYQQRFEDVITSGVIKKVVSKLETTPSELTAIITRLLRGEE